MKHESSYLSGTWVLLLALLACSCAAASAEYGSTGLKDFYGRPLQDAAHGRQGNYRDNLARIANGESDLDSLEALVAAYAIRDRELIELNLERTLEQYGEAGVQEFAARVKYAEGESGLKTAELVRKAGLRYEQALDLQRGLEEDSAPSQQAIQIPTVDAGVSAADEQPALSRTRDCGFLEYEVPEHFVTPVDFEQGRGIFAIRHTDGSLLPMWDANGVEEEPAVVFLMFQSAAMPALGLEDLARTMYSQDRAIRVSEVNGRGVLNSQGTVETTATTTVENVLYAQVEAPGGERQTILLTSGVRLTRAPRADELFGLQRIAREVAENAHASVRLKDGFRWASTAVSEDRPRIIRRAGPLTYEIPANFVPVPGRRREHQVAADFMDMDGFFSVACNSSTPPGTPPTNVAMKENHIQLESHLQSNELLQVEGLGEVCVFEQSLPWRDELTHETHAAWSKTMALRLESDAGLVQVVTLGAMSPRGQLSVQQAYVDTLFDEIVSSIKIAPMWSVAP